MVAIVNKKLYTPYAAHEVLLKLPDGFCNMCNVSEFYEGKNTYEDEIVIGNEMNDHILLRGVVIHNIVRSVMRNVPRKTKMNMIEHLKYLIEQEDR